MVHHVENEKQGNNIIAPVSLSKPFTALVPPGNGLDEGGISLPVEFREIYGSDWVLPCGGSTPYVYVNFVISHDGRISFGGVGAASGAEVSSGNAYDIWLMALLRARADAVLIGDGILRQEPYALCTAAFMCPGDAESFASLREHDGRRERYLYVVVSQCGDIPADAATLRNPDVDTLIVTTEQGREACEALCRDSNNSACQTRVVEGEDGRVDVAALVQILGDEYGVRSIVCEGGAFMYGSMLQAGLVNDEFLSIAPLIIGPSQSEAERRPSLVDGTKFDSTHHPRFQVLSVHSQEDFVFLRSRVVSLDPA